VCTDGALSGGKRPEREAGHHGVTVMACTLTVFWMKAVRSIAPVFLS
jgi:hypothetical protein